MKKKITAVVLSIVMSVSAMGLAYAEETSDNNQQNTTIENTETEKETERETEKETEKQTEKLTEPTTKEQIKVTEPTTSSTTTTTTKTPSKLRDEKKEYSLTLAPGASESIESYVKDTNIPIDAFNWYSSDSKVATVSTKGQISAIKEGSTTISGSALDGSIRYVFDFDIKVSSSSSESETKSLSMYVGDTKDLYSYVDDKYVARDYDWSVSNTRYATISSKGVLSAVKEGKVTVTAKISKNGTTKEYEFKIDIDDDGDGYSSSSSSSKKSKYSDSSSSYTKSKVSAKTSWTLYMGSKQEIDVSGILDESPSRYDWSTNDSSVVAIDEDDGVINAKSEGTAKVYAKGDRDYTFTVKIDSDYSCDTITVKGSKAVALEDYLPEDVDEYNFNSERDDVATVDNDGEVRAVANGVGAVVCKHEDGDIVMYLVNVSGADSYSKTTTRETTTEETTSIKVTDKTKSEEKINKDSSVSFKDISHRSWAIDSINIMAARGIIAGVGNNKFSPDANCKRCDFTIVLTKILGMGADTVSSNYSDVSTGAYYYNYVGVAKINGIESGIKNDKFRPDEFITREEMMVMVYKGIQAVQGNTLNEDTSVLDKFTDAKLIDNENKKAVAALVNSGAISGTSDTTLDSKSNITRAQMAVIMNKVDQMINK